VKSATERVLVLYEQSRAGTAAIDQARVLAEREHATLTVVAVAPQAPSGPRSANSAGARSARPTTPGRRA
jgi:K+-sensing histidine kinase KdpD